MSAFMAVRHDAQRFISSPIFTGWDAWKEAIAAVGVAGNLT